MKTLTGEAKGPSAARLGSNLSMKQTLFADGNASRRASPKPKPLKNEILVAVPKYTKPTLPQSRTSSIGQGLGAERCAVRFPRH